MSQYMGSYSFCYCKIIYRTFKIAPVNFQYAPDIISKLYYNRDNVYILYSHIRKLLASVIFAKGLYNCFSLTKYDLWLPLPLLVITQSGCVCTKLALSDVTASLASLSIMSSCSVSVLGHRKFMLFGKKKSVFC
jgi:hypothetical protein